MRLAVLCVALAACGTNPAFDPPTPTGPPAETTARPTSSGPSATTSSGTADLTSTSTMSVDTSGPADSSSSPTTTATPDTTSTTTGTTTSDSTTDTACVMPGAACDEATPCCGKCTACDMGTCIRNDALCGTCGVCNSEGACEQAKQNAPCDPSLEACDNQIWGLQDGVCYATLPFGHCNKDGACEPNCVDKGAPLATCDPLCVRSDHMCFSGSELDKVSFDTFCYHQNTPAGNCLGQCNMDGSAVDLRRCDPNGTCVDAGPQPCEPYLCESMTAVCTTSCNTMADCAPGHACSNFKCI